MTSPAKQETGLFVKIQTGSITLATVSAVIVAAIAGMLIIATAIFFWLRNFAQCSA